ncbi:MAG: AgmX/PglI C-terminal domain-containing protein [Oligoflexus sp.]|nr:AgmX/PglI C-terminal domain-containing protein [Oligoflexus sp.]
MKNYSLLFMLFSATPLFGQNLTKDEIQKVVRSNTDQVRSCYEQFTKRTPGLAGKIRMEIKLDKDGHVESSKAADSSFEKPEIAQCIEGKVKRWHFPAPGPTDRKTFSYPFSFGTEGEAPVAIAPTIISTDDARVYKGRVFKRSNRPITDIAKLQEMTGNTLIKAVSASCDNIKLLKKKCEDLEAKNRVVCPAMTDSAPKKPFTPDWLLIEHPDAFRIESGTYFMGYWHISCEELNKFQ